jgi:glycosyltransferase involved in cell wall biosynthesis
MMRILHVTPSYKPAFRYGGPTFSVSCLAEQQAKAGAEVWVFTTTANGEEELPVCRGVPIEVEGVRVVYFSRWTGDHGHFCPALWWAVWRKGRNFDVVHVHSWWNWVAFGVALVSRLRGLRMVFSPHGMLSPYTLRHSLKRWFQRILGRWLLARALWHATSRLEERELQVHKPPNPTICVPNITPFPDTTAIQAPAPRAALRLLYLSRLDPKKGLDFLLNVLAEIKGGCPWQLTVVGDASNPFGREMRKLAERLGLKDRVVWHGWASGEEKWNLLAWSDLLLLPSQNENFAIIVLEALAVGTAVLVSDRVGLCDYVHEKDLGWCAPLDEEAWRLALKAAMSDDAKRRRIRREAPIQVRRDFDPETLVWRYLEVYRRPSVQVIFRKPAHGGHYSIERSFSAFWPYLSEDSAGVYVRRVVARAPSRGLLPRLRIGLQMLFLRADVFHISGDIHFAALFLSGRKTLLTIHDCGFMQHPQPWKRFVLSRLWLRWPVRHCRHIVAVSEATKADIMRYTGCAEAKVSVIPSAIPSYFAPIPKPFEVARPRILHIGSAPNKNLRRHIEALEGIRCVLHIVGRIGREERQLLERCGVVYECTPDLDDAGVLQAYAYCDLLLFASTSEGFGMPIIEAQTVGRPVVTSNCSSMPEVAGVEGACLVDPFDVASIRAGVLRVIKDPDYREALVKRGFENVCRFQPQAIARAYCALYRAFLQPVGTPIHPSPE